MIKAVIFDFDGVIADTLSFTFKEIVKNSWLLSTKNKSEEKIIEKIRESNYRKLMKDFKINWLKLPLILFLVKRAQYKLFEQIENFKPFKNIKNVLNFIKKNNLKLFLVSSNIKKNIEKFLNHHQINYFDEIYTPKNFFGKDRIFLEILKKYQLKKDEVVYIGDELRDLQAAKKAGIRFIGVSWGLAKESVFKENKGDFIVKNPQDIINVLKSLI